MSAPDYEFVGSKNSYYSAKVRAALQYKRIPYTETCANADTIGRVKRLTGEHIYPVVVCPDGAVLRDSCEVVEALEARHPERPVIPEDPVLRLVATLLETVADDLMIRTSIQFRWLEPETREWSVRMFRQICGERMSGPARSAARENGEKIAGKISGRLAHMGLTPEVQGTCARVTREICDRLEAHLADTPFLLGDRPCLADLGMLNGLYAHLYRDPGPISEHLRRRCIAVSLWIDHMLAAAGESDRGALFATESLGELLAFLGEAYGPLASAALDLADAQLPRIAAGEPAPPGLGLAETTLLGTPLRTPVASYLAWKLQRLADRYRAVPESARPEADRWLARAGFLELCRREPSWRLDEHGFALTAGSA